MESFDGRNYRIELADERLLIARLHRRPDLDTSAGADDVERMTETIHAASTGDVDGLLLDLTEAPAVMGPRTQAALQTLLGAWATSGRRAVLVVGPSAVQRLQIERWVGDIGSSKVFVSTSLDVAKVWLRGSL